MKGQVPKENRNLRTPSAFLPYQAAWAEDQAQVKVYEKSRRIGISWAEAAEDALLAASEHGMDVYYVGYTKDMALEFIEDCAAWCKHYSLLASEVEEFVFEDDDERKIQAFRVRFDSGFKIEALSSRPRNVRGKQGKFVLDEAAFHDDLPGLLKAVMAALIWGGRVVIISTHNGDEHPFNELVQSVRAEKLPYSIHRTTLDDAIAQGLYKRVCLRLGKEWTLEGEEAWKQAIVTFYGADAEEELFCIPSKGGGIYLPRAMIERCMQAGIPVIRWRCPDDFAHRPDHDRQTTAEDWCAHNLKPLLDGLDKNAPSYFGEDFGRSGDLTVIWPAQEMQDLTLRPPFVLELRNVPFLEQQLILFYVASRLPRFRGGALDARGNGEFLAERAMQRFGRNRIWQVKLTQEWYIQNMPRYKDAIESGKFLMPEDGDILDDHRAVIMEKGVAKVPDTARGKGRDGLQRHGDAAIAGALLNFAAREGKGKGHSIWTLAEILKAETERQAA